MNVGYVYMYICDIYIYRYIIYISICVYKPYTLLLSLGNVKGFITLRDGLWNLISLIDLAWRIMISPLSIEQPKIERHRYIEHIGSVENLIWPKQNQAEKMAAISQTKFSCLWSWITMF